MACQQFNATPFLGKTDAQLEYAGTAGNNGPTFGKRLRRTIARGERRIAGLRGRELNAEIGARAFGAPLMRHFLPREARDPYVFRLLSSPALARLAAEPEAVPAEAEEAAAAPGPEKKAAKPRRKKRRSRRASRFS